MRVFFSSVGIDSLILGTLLLLSGASIAQNPPVSHVVIPNPTPRQPDLKQVYGNTPEEQRKQEELSLQGQLNAREVWLESNQLLLLAQQLQQDVISGKKSPSMQANAAKVAQIEKLAKTMQEKMKAH